jgi:hypothetical protein
MAQAYPYFIAQIVKHEYLEPCVTTLKPRSKIVQINRRSAAE